MNEIDKLTEDQYKTLPPNLQRAIKAVPWKTIVRDIGKTNLLSVEQTVSLEQETMLVIYGFENPRNYLSNLAREVGIDQEKATLIANVVSERVLSVIDEKVNGMTNINNQVIEQSFTPITVPEIPPTTLPMIEKGETAHDVPHSEPTINQEQPKAEKVSLPDYRYPDGQDPYREALK